MLDSSLSEYHFYYHNAKMIFPYIILNSSINFSIHIASLLASIVFIYFASVVNKPTTRCNLYVQLIAQLERVKVYPIVDFYPYLSPPKLESTKPLIYKYTNL